MSFQAMAWAVKQKLPTRDKFVLLMLANYANEIGKCWPSFNRLADDTGLCRRSIILSLQALSSGGIIDVEERKLDGQNITNIYTVRHGSPDTIQSHDVSSSSAVVAPPVQGLHHGVVQQMHRGSAVVAPKPIREPIKRNNIYSSFEQFWLGYPRKVGKGAAEKAWIKAIQETEASVIIASLGSHKFSEDVNFIPHPATWLSQRRWEDVAPVVNGCAAPRPDTMGILAPEASFPSDGSIEYTPWASRIRAHNTGHDPDWIANGFRNFCRSKNIEFNSPHIVKALDGFTRAQKRV